MVRITPDIAVVDDHQNPDVLREGRIKVHVNSDSDSQPDSDRRTIWLVKDAQCILRSACCGGCYAQECCVE